MNTKTTFATHISLNKISCPVDKIESYGHYIEMENRGSKNDGIFVDDDDGKLLKIRCHRYYLDMITPNVKHMFPEIHDVFEICANKNETDCETTCVVMEYVNGGDLTNFLFLAYPRSKLSENHKMMFDDFSFLYDFMHRCFYDEILFPTIYEIYSDTTRKSFDEKAIRHCSALMNRCVFEVLENNDEHCYSRQVIVKTIINNNYVTYTQYFDGGLMKKLCELEKNKDDDLMKWIKGIIESVFFGKIKMQYYYCAKMFDLFNKGYTIDALNEYHNEYKKCVMEKIKSVEGQLMKNFVILYENDLKYHDYKTDNFGVRLNNNDFNDFEILFLDIDSGLYPLVSKYYKKESFGNEYRHYKGVMKMSKFGNGKANDIYCLSQSFLCCPYIEDLFKKNDAYNFLRTIMRTENGNNFQ